MKVFFYFVTAKLQSQLNIIRETVLMSLIINLVGFDTKLFNLLLGCINIERPLDLAKILQILSFKETSNIIS